MRQERIQRRPVKRRDVTDETSAPRRSVKSERVNREAEQTLRAIDRALRGDQR